MTKKKRNNKEEDIFEMEEVFLEDIEVIPMNDIYLPLSRFSEDGHSWNGKAYIDYPFKCGGEEWLI